jgi:hypothetical protein
MQSHRSVERSKGTRSASRVWRAVLAAVLGLCPLAPAPADASLGVTSAFVQRRPRQARFYLTGRIDGLDVAGIDAIDVRFGKLTQTVPLDQFRVLQSGLRLFYRDSRVHFSGDSGIQKLDLNLRRGTVKLYGWSPVLLDAAGPVVVRIAAHGDEQCAVLQLRPLDSITSAFKSRSGDVQSACHLSGPVRLSADSLLRGVQTTVTATLVVRRSWELDAGQPELFRVDELGRPVGSPLCTLRDDGNTAGGGDELALDGEYTCTFSVQENAAGTLRLMARSTALGNVVMSPIASLNVVEDLTDADLTLILNTEPAAAQVWAQKSALYGDTTQARLETAAVIRTWPGIADAGISPDGFSLFILYQSGVEGGLLLNPPGTRGRVVEPSVPRIGALHETDAKSAGPSARRRKPRSIGSAPAARTVGNQRVLIWSPFTTEFPVDGVVFGDLFASSSCPRFADPTKIEDAAADVASVSRFTDFGTIIVSSHGFVTCDRQVAFLTGERVTQERLNAHRAQIRNKLVGTRSGYFTILPHFIETLRDEFRNANVFMGTCLSAANSGMANAFLSKGAASYIGFDQVVGSPFVVDSGRQFFREMLVEQQPADRAFDAIMPKQDVRPQWTTTILRYGSSVQYSGLFGNPSFESDLDRWTGYGDVRLSGLFGGMRPTSGSSMLSMSTGAHPAFDAFSLAEQTFCLPPGSAWLSFDYNVISEEFKELCWLSPLDSDGFSVEVLDEDLFSSGVWLTVVDLCSNLVPTNLIFDQSGPACHPCITHPEALCGSCPGLSPGAEALCYSDCTVWSAGWRSDAVDLTSLTDPTRAKGVTLRVSVGAGPFFDPYNYFKTAVLFDNFQITQ